MDVLTVGIANARRRRNQVQALAAGFGGDDDAPVSGSRAERYQVFLHVDRDTLAEEGEAGRSELEDGTRVSAETSRRLSCDTGLVGVLRGEGGEVLDVGAGGGRCPTRCGTRRSRPASQPSTARRRSHGGAPGVRESEWSGL